MTEYDEKRFRDADDPYRFSKEWQDYLASPTVVQERIRVKGETIDYKKRRKTRYERILAEQEEQA